MLQMVIIVDENDKVITTTNLKGTDKNKLLELGNIFINIASSVYPEKYNNSKAQLKSWN